MCKIDHLINAKGMPVLVVMREIMSKKEGRLPAGGKGRERVRASRQMDHECLGQGAIAFVMRAPRTLVKHERRVMHHFRAAPGRTAVSH